MDLVPVLTAALAGIAAVLGGVAAVAGALSRRRTDRETSEEAAARRVREERDALTLEWKALLDPYRAEVGRLSGRVEVLEAQLVTARKGHEECEARISTLTTELRIAQGKIAELGG